MENVVRPEIYGVMPVAQVESLLRRETMPAPFIRRMRVINLLSALTLRKIDDDMIAPFEVMDIHHILDEQISQDAIIAMLENKNLALALETGDMQPLYAESKEETLLRRGFNQKWIQRFITTPFDPVCVMLAMRAKLMLDVVDELGHSYDLLRALGMGWIDFGEIPGEDPGNPDDYIPPLIYQPIDDPNIPVDGVPGDPDRVPGPDESDYIPPPDRIPGDPGYDGVPGEPPGYPEGWDEAIHPGHPDYDPGPGDRGYYPGPSPGGGLYGGDYGPGGKGAPGGPYGAGGDYASLLPPLPLGYGPGWLLSGRGFGGRWGGGGINCCLNKDEPLQKVEIGYLESTINKGETLGLTVKHAHEDCDGENYTWFELNEVGSLSAETGLDTIYTAPATGADCPGNAEIWLICGNEVVDSLVVTINYDYAIEFNYGDPELEIAPGGELNISVEATGTPLTWSVPEGEFSLESVLTQGNTNKLISTGDGCGSVEITITDCDGNSTTGFVRCTTGTWNYKGKICGLSGSGILTYSVPDRAQYEKIEGNKKQWQEVGLSGNAATQGCWDVSTDCGALCGEYGCAGCLDWVCGDMYYKGPCGGFCCYTSDLPDPCGGAGTARGGKCIRIKDLKYYEWECPA